MRGFQASPPCPAVLLALAIAAAPIPAPGQEGPGGRASASDVKDGGRMFSEGAVRRAVERLRSIEQRSGVPVVIETIPSLDGQGVEEVAERRYERDGLKGIYYLLAEKEHRISEPQLPAALREKIGPNHLSAIREAFISEFRERRFDEGLHRAVTMIGQLLADAKVEAPAAGSAPVSGTSPAGPTTLVQRQQVRLTLEGAKRLLAGAEAKAAEMGQKSNIAVVDDGGHLLAFARMDGARPASVYTAITKATTAATFRQATGPLRSGDKPADPLLNLSLQNAAAASGGKVTTLFGGLPVVVDGQVIGGVGVGGGTGEQDAEVAKAGIDAFLDALRGEGRDSGGGRAGAGGAGDGKQF